MKLFLSSYGALCLGLLILTFLLAIWAVSIGPANISVGQLLAGLWHGDPQILRVFFEIRLPRVALGLLAGASLGCAGAAMQGLLRNPLAEPGLLGVSGGAALGAVIALYSGFVDSFWLALPLAGFIGTALVTGLVFWLASGTHNTTVLILAGVAISSLCASAISLILNLSSNPFAAMEIVFWTLGSVADRSNNDLLLATPPILLGLILLCACGRGLRALSLGEDTAHSLGIHVIRLKTQILIGSALCVGAAVSVAGAIGFIGLVAPHLVRPLVRFDPARLLPVSALAGAALLTAADIGVRLLQNTGPEIKLGVLTALVGAPFFIVLIRQAGRQAT